MQNADERDSDTQNFRGMLEQMHACLDVAGFESLQGLLDTALDETWLHAGSDQ
jgi:hypothetical protein